MSADLAPQPDNYPCNDPDYSKPLPGEVLRWNGPKRPVVLSQPQGFFADPWAKAAAQAGPCPPKRIGPPVHVLETGEVPPRIF